MKKTSGTSKGGLVSKLTRLVTSVKFIVSLGILVVLGTIVAWQYYNSTNIDRVFWGMVDSNLQTTAYTRHSTLRSGSQSVDQILQTSTQPTQTVHSETTFTQTGIDATTAVTENIGTPTHDYVRYTNITTAAKRGSSGKPVDFSNILNVWGVTDPQDPDRTEGQLYNQATLGVIPTGNIPVAERRLLIKLMKEQRAYSYKVVETTKSGPLRRPTYKLAVTIHPVGYITAIKQFASQVGLNHLEQVDPAQYKNAQELVFMVSADGWTHQMTETNQSAGNRTEAVSGRNLRKALPKPPTDTISVDELQSRLQVIE